MDIPDDQYRACLPRLLAVDSYSECEELDISARVLGKERDIFTVKVIFNNLEQIRNRVVVLVGGESGQEYMYATPDGAGEAKIQVGLPHGIKPSLLLRVRFPKAGKGERGWEG